MEEKYEFYNALKIGDVVIVEWSSFNPKYYNYYVSTVKSIKQINESDYVCRLDIFNYDFELLNQKDTKTPPFSAGQNESGVYMTLSGELADNGFSFKSKVYSIEEFKRLLQQRNSTDRNSMYISDYNHLIKMHQALIEAIELQNEQNINQSYVLHINNTDDPSDTDIYFYKNKPSIKTIKTKIGCNFRTAEEIYKLEPLYYEYNEFEIILTKIDKHIIDSNITDIYEIYDNDYTSSKDVLSFINTFKNTYNIELNKLYKQLNTLLSIDELLYDWYMDISTEEIRYTEDINGFKNFLIHQLYIKEE